MKCAKCGTETAIAYYTKEAVQTCAGNEELLCWKCYFEGDAFPSTEQQKPQPDAVVHPSHYAKGGVECIQAIKASMTPEAYRGYLKGNVLKYLWRYESKGRPVQDLEKAAVYLGWLLDEVKADDK